MMRTPTAVGTMLLLTTSLAHAQTEPFGGRGEFILSADRLLPLLSYTRTAESDLPPGSGSLTTTQTALSLFWGSTAPEELFFTVPRVGLDYVLIPNLTVGGDALVYTTLGSGTSTKANLAGGGSITTSAGDGGMFVFGVAPRAGYVLHLTSMLSVWLRGGLSFYTSDTKLADGTHLGLNQFALDIDPQLVVALVPHFGITAGVTADLPIAGEHSQTTYNADGSSREVSASSSVLFVDANVGLMGYF
jgi:hypothetical protein